MSVFAQLQSKCIGLIEAFHDDLNKHDKAAIDNRPGVPFVHVTRKHGTHVVFMPAAADYPAPGVFVPYLFADANREHVLTQVVEFADYWLRPRAEPVKAVHYFDGRRLVEISLEKAQQVLREYGRRVRNDWHRPDYRPGAGTTTDGGVMAAVA